MALLTGTETLVLDTNKKNMKEFQKLAFKSLSIIHLAIGTEQDGKVNFFSNKAIPVKTQIELLEYCAQQLKNKI